MMAASSTWTVKCSAPSSRQLGLQAHGDHGENSEFLVLDKVSKKYADSADFSICTSKQEPFSSKALAVEVPRERRRKQEQDLDQEALATSHTDTSIRNALGKVVFQTTEVLLGRQILGPTWVGGAPDQRGKCTHAPLAITAS